MKIESVVETIRFGNALVGIMSPTAAVTMVVTQETIKEDLKFYADKTVMKVKTLDGVVCDGLAPVRLGVTPTRTVIIEIESF